MSFARPAAAGLLAILLAAVLATPASAWPVDRWGHQERRPREGRVQSVLKAARSQLGTPYRYGGSSPGGFDCSGFTRWSWAHGGDQLPHSASAQYDVVRWHVKRGQLRPGDLLFFYRPISHVAIFVGDGKMVEAPHSGARVRVIQIYWQYFTAAARPK
jgi:cell wall-associated NlpC family hydrolase